MSLHVLKLNEHQVLLKSLFRYCVGFPKLGLRREAMPVELVVLFYQIQTYHDPCAKIKVPCKSGTWTTDLGKNWCPGAESGS